MMYKTILPTQTLLFLLQIVFADVEKTKVHLPSLKLEKHMIFYKRFDPKIGYDKEKSNGQVGI